MYAKWTDCKMYPGKVTAVNTDGMSYLFFIIFVSRFLFSIIGKLESIPWSRWPAMVFEVKKKTRGQCQILQMCSGRLSVVGSISWEIFFCLTKVNLLHWFPLRSRWPLLKVRSKGKVQLLWIWKVLFTSNLLNLDVHINLLHWCPYRSIKHRLILRLQS